MRLCLCRSDFRLVSSDAMYVHAQFESQKKRLLQENKMQTNIAIVLQNLYFDNSLSTRFCRARLGVCLSVCLSVCLY